MKTVLKYEENIKRQSQIGKVIPRET